uniref:Uncharacterized protein n=1 Tax=Cacopsylla melanoneura TaxID=428564 RepID=A0A8D8X1V5_9HEMI
MYSSTASVINCRTLNSLSASISTRSLSGCSGSSFESMTLFCTLISCTMSPYWAKWRFCSFLAPSKTISFTSRFLPAAETSTSSLVFFFFSSNLSSTGPLRSSSRVCRLPLMRRLRIRVSTKFLPLDSSWSD